MKSESIRLNDGMISVVLFDNAKTLTKHLKKLDPRYEGYKLIYGEYRSDPSYISYGTLHLSKESSFGLIAHEIYHAIRHASRVKNPGLFGNRDGKIGRTAEMREEREADMFGQLFNAIVERLKK